ncbi:MAG: chromosomal replication initiator protein DnaA [Bacteroidota bacterium]
MREDYQAVWDRCLRLIKKQVSAQSYKTWFEPIVPKKLANSTLTIQVPSQFFYEWLEEHYLMLLRQVIDQELGPQGKLEYSIIVDKGNSPQNPMTVQLPGQHHTAKHQKSEERPLQNPFALKSLQDTQVISVLNPHYTFDNFIEGDYNRLAKSAAQAVAKKPGGTSFNPLMIYGGIGLGKTHVIQALGNELKRNFPDKFILYVSSEQFTAQFIEALRNNSIQDFSHFYLQADLLMIDDVQFLAGKEKTQEIFFHIFNHLHQAGKQIVMTSDCPPRELKGLQERLLSRFKWGLTADLQQPDLETRTAIIHSKMAADGMQLPDELAQYVAYSVDTNIRELEGVLISLIAHASLNKQEISLSLAQQVLKNIVQDIAVEVNLDYIQKAVASHYHVSLEQLKSKSRKRELVTARQVGMYLAKRHTNHSLKSIGQYFGGRDHSTVIYALQTVNDLLDIDQPFRSSFEDLQQKIKFSRNHSRKA